MQIITSMQRFYAATLGRVYSALPPKSTDTPITLSSLKAALKEDSPCKSTMY
jgi:hypothetical protein